MAKYSEIIERMTIEQKASLVTAAGGWSKIVAADKSISAMSVSDGTCGVKIGKGLETYGAPATRFPSPLNIARSWDLKAGAYVADTIAKEAAALGVNVLVTPEGGVILDGADESGNCSFSEDPYLSGKMLSAYVRGYEHGGAMASVPVGKAATGGFFDDEKSLREIALQPYEMAVKEGEAPMIRISHKNLGGETAAESKHLVSGIIGTEWQYGGIIAAEDGGHLNAAKAMALGSSMIISDSVSAEAQRLARAVENHKRIMADIAGGTAKESVLAAAISKGEAVAEALLDEALDKIFCTVEKYDLGEPVQSERYDSYPFNHKVMFDEQAHGKMAYEAALKSLVLLRNDGVLPIAEDKKTAFIGECVFLPLAACGVSADFVALDNEITANLLGKSGLTVTGSAKGFSRNAGAGEAASMKLEAMTLAADAEVVVIYVGDISGTDGGNGRLPKNQLEFLSELRRSTKAKIVAVDLGRSIVDMSWNDMCDAVLLAGDPGQGGAKAILKVISGACNPSGKLTQTVCDIPTSESGNTQMYGYRMCQARNIEERYPFGHGLSYTEFDYSDIEVSCRGVGFTVTNTGKVAGEEIAQVYVGREDSLVTAVRKELKGFCKVRLEAGESKRVEVRFDSKAFRYYNTDTESWETEGGYYQIYVASSSRNIRLLDEVYVESSGAVVPVIREETETQNDEPQKKASFVENISLGKFIALVGSIAAVGLLAILYIAFLRDELMYALDIDRDAEIFVDIICGGLFVGGIAALVAVMIVMLRGANVDGAVTAATTAVHSQSEYKPDKVYPDDWQKIFFDGEAETEEESIFASAVSEEDEQVVKPSDCKLVRRSAFDTLEGGIATLGKGLAAYVAERKINVSEEELTELFAAVAASRTVAVRSTDAASVATVMECMGECFDWSVYHVEAHAEDTSVAEVLRKNDGVSLIEAVNNAVATPDKPCVAVISEACCDDLGEYLGEIVGYSGNAALGYEVSFGEDTVILPDNMWFVVIIADDRSVLTGNTCVVRLHADASLAMDINTAMAQDYDNTEIAAYTLPCHILFDLLERERETKYLSEKYWRKIDKLEEHIGASIPFSLSNKTVNAMEKFLCVCISCGIEQTSAMDCAVASLMLSSLSDENADSLAGEETLAEFMDSVFGADKDDRSREVIKLKGVK